MSEFYDNIDSNDTESNKEYSRMYQPNFTRTRQTYKGTRDSEKINLEINQVMFDIYSINEKIQVIKQAQEDVMDSLENGYVAEYEDGWPYLDEDAQSYWSGYSTYVDFVLYALEDLQEQVVIYTNFLHNYMNGIM